MSTSLPAQLLVLAVAVLAVLTWRWTPAIAAPEVTQADVARDFTSAEQARERGYRRRVRPWGLASTALSVLVPTVLVLSGAAASVDVGTGRWWVDVLAVTSFVLVLTRLATLPAGIAVRSAALEVGLAAGTWGRWWRDVLLAFALGWMLTGLAALGWVAAVRTWPVGWWLPVSVSAALLVVLGSFVLPVLVEPLFTRFSPLPDGAVRRDLLALAALDAVPVGEVLVADASRRTNALNAYVSGLGRTRRIVVHDTLLEDGSDDDVRAVVAHELGHVVAHDVRTGTVLGAGGAAVSVLAAYVVLSFPGVLAATHISGPGDPAVVSVLLALASWAALLSAPAQNALSRRIERRADEHGLGLTGDPASMAAMHRTLAVVNVASLRPPRALHLWFGTHPTSPERIAAARRWGAAHGVAVAPRLVADEDVGGG